MNRFSLSLLLTLVISATVVLALGPPAKAQSTPEWAVGQWEMIDAHGNTGLLAIQADGHVTWQWPNMPLLGTGCVDEDGGLRLVLPLLDSPDAVRATGELSAEGTAKGTLGLALVWTACKGSPERPDPNSYEGKAPFWAVGEWQVHGPGDDKAVITVEHDGTVTMRFDSAPDMPITGSIDPTGVIRIETTILATTVTVEGKLTPHDTGRGYGGAIHFWQAHRSTAQDG